MLALLIDIYSLIVFISVLLSWFPVSPDNPLVRVSNTVVEPVLQPIRRVIPAMGGFDLSPLVLLLGLRLLRRLLVGF